MTTPHGVRGIEAKSGIHLAPSSWRALQEVGNTLGDAWRGGLVVYGGTALQKLGTNLWAVPVDRLLA